MVSVSCLFRKEIQTISVNVNIIFDILFKHMLVLTHFFVLFVLIPKDNQAAASADQGSLPGLPQRRHANCS